MPHKETSDLRRLLALPIILLFGAAVWVASIHHHSPKFPAQAVLASSQRLRLMPDDTDPTTTTTLVPPQAAALAVRWPPSPRHSRCSPRLLDQIPHNEDPSGDPKAVNRSSGAGGLWQIIPSTWKSNGGAQYAPTADQATPEQQRAVAQKIYAEQGTRPWKASGC